jgi:hypothetical protein
MDAHCIGCNAKRTDKGQMKTNEHEVVKEIKKIRPIQRLFLLDVLLDKDSRPTFLWALSMLVLGTLVYHWFEGWSYLDSLYFCVISLATVGYGDLTPTTPLAKHLYHQWNWHPAGAVRPDSRGSVAPL